MESFFVQVIMLEIILKCRYCEYDCTSYKQSISSVRKEGKKL